MTASAPRLRISAIDRAEGRPGRSGAPVTASSGGSTFPDGTGGRRPRHQVSLAILEIAFEVRGGGPPADHSGVSGEAAFHDRAEIAHVELQRRERLVFDGEGGEGGAHRNVGEVAEDAAVDGAHGVVEALLQSLRRDRSELEKLLAECSDHWGYEDSVYRFYHQSFKVYGLQGRTQSIVQRLQSLAPERPLHPWFTQIVEAGTGKVFKTEDNSRWLEVTRPILEAFFHARFFLEMAVRYENLQAPPQVLPSGYAALLYLFRLR